MGSRFGGWYVIPQEGHSGAAAIRQLEVARRFGLGYKGLMAMPKKRPDAVQQLGDVPSTELRERFGLNFKSLRKRAGLTQVQVAQQAGIVQTEISRIELGKVNVTLGTMQRLARVVGHDVEKLLSRSPYPPTKK